MLVAHGIGKGDVVSLLMPNSVEYIIAYFACWKLGALAGPVNSLLKEHETAFVLNNSEAKAILVHSEFQERIEKIRAELPQLESVITFDDESGSDTRVLSEGRKKAGRMPALQVAFQYRQRRRRDHHLHLGHHWKAKGLLANPRQRNR